MTDFALKKHRGPIPSVSGAITSELEELTERHGGVLQAEDVVQAAQKAGSAMHHLFEWDNTKAAEKFRLIQARTLISVAVTYLESPEDGKRVPMKVFVNLKEDRFKESGGYRTMVSVLHNTKLRELYMKEALENLESFKQKYQDLQQLSLVMEAIDKTVKKQRGPAEKFIAA